MSEKKDFELVRIFNAPLELVWKAHTDAEQLAKWWGPVGFKMLKCTVDLRVGGMFLYGMESSEGYKLWGKFVYHEIVPQTKLVYVDSFSNEQGGITRHPMAANWPLEILNTLTLLEKDRKTILTLRLKPINETNEESAMFYGSFSDMNQGYGGTYNQLVEYIANTK